MARHLVQTAVTRRGQTVVPASIRRQHGIGNGDRIAWLDDGEVIRVVPLSADPVRALRGTGSGERLLERLLHERKADRESKR